MTRWAKHLGAFVIGIVSKQDSVALAETLGCDAVLVFNPETLAADVATITNGKKADVVYDPIGKVSFNASLDSLRPRGTPRLVRCIVGRTPRDRSRNSERQGLPLLDPAIDRGAHRDCARVPSACR